MKQTRYKGEFASRDGIAWRAELQQEAAAPFERVGELEFPAEEPLVIEWQRADKEAPVQGSAATLRVISPGDRTFADLYGVEPGRVRLNVYRTGSLYWSGLLDPEFYEEPYERLDGYEVTLTFTDFGILDRLPYGLTGLRTLREVVEHAVQSAGILLQGDMSAAIDAGLVTTCLAPSGESIVGGKLSVRSDNFIDEEGEPATLREAVEGILQPLGIRMVQREGRVWLYDLNGLYNSGTEREIAWDGDSQTLGTDKAVNRVRITFSPYAEPAALSGELAYGGKYNVNYYNFSNNAPAVSEGYGEFYSYYADYAPETTSTTSGDAADFTIFLHDRAEGLAAIGEGCKYFHIQPGTGSAPECSGVAYAFRTGGHGNIKSGLPAWKLHNGIPRASLDGTPAVLATRRAFIPKTAGDSCYYLRLTLEMLLDARYNPFSGSENDNEPDNDRIFRTRCNYIFIPARVTLYSDSGTALYHYKNSHIASSARLGRLSAARGEWVAGADTGNSCWLEYYDPEDYEGGTGIRGWRGNRHCIGRPDYHADFRMYDSFKKMGDGEYIPYPPQGGWIEVQVLSGLFGYDHGDHERMNFGDPASLWDRAGYADRVRWLLYKAPVLEVLTNGAVAQEPVESGDIEYSGTINAAAKDDLDIETICGTTQYETALTARGHYIETATGLQARRFSRAGIEGQPEKLLLGTLHSQYAGRMTTLSGEALIRGGLHAYTERNQPGKRFVLKSDVQNLITGCTEAEYCEFRPDEYEAEMETETEGKNA